MPEEVGVFLVLGVVDELDMLIGNLLDFVEPLSLIVLRNHRVLQQFLLPVVCVAPHAAHGIAAFLGELVHVA